MRAIRSFLTLALFAATLSLGSRLRGATVIPITGVPVPELAAFDAAVTNFMRANGIKGGAFAMMKDGRLVLKHGYGWSNQAQTTPFDPDSRVRIASNSKTFAAAAIKLLIDRRVISTNTLAVPFTGIQPYNGRWGDARYQNITVLQLIAHTSGFPRPTDQSLPPTVMLLDHYGTPRERLSYLVTQPLNFAPGSSFEYTGSSYSLLGRVIEKASGLDFITFVQRHVARTWGIRGLHLERTEPKLRAPDEPWYDSSTGSGGPGPNLAAFPTQEIVPWADGAEYYYESTDSGGGLITSVEGLVRLAQICLISHGPAYNPVAGTPTTMNGDRRRWRHLTKTGAQSGWEAGARSFNLQNINGVDFAVFFNLEVQEPVFGDFVFALKRLTETTTNWPGDNTMRITLAANSFTVGEEESELVIGVRRTGDSHGEVSVNYSTAEGTAYAGTDFTSVAGTLTFADDEIAQTIKIPILNNETNDSNRAFTLVLSNATAGAQLDIAIATVTIEDDDQPHVPPAIELVSPAPGTVSLPGTNLSIIVSANAGNRPISKVEYFAGPTLLGEENKSPYSFVWKKPASGSYLLTSRATDDWGLTVASSPVLVNIYTNNDPAAPSPGPLLREFWTRRPGSTLAGLTNYAHFPVRPTGWEYLISFETRTNWGHYYGARLRGYLLPPADGSYVFWIAADDQAQLWLSTDQTPANKRLIASVNTATAPRQWDSQASQQSLPIPLETGRRYYIEALHKQRIGNDHLAVGWQLPGGELERPIPWTRLEPFDLPELVPSFTAQGFVLSFNGLPDRDYVIEATTNLTNWVSVSTNTAAALSRQFQDAEAAHYASRFYRVKQLP